MPTKQEIALSNETLLSQLSDPALVKNAEDTVQNFTRTRMREDGFYPKIIPPLPVTNDQLTRRVDTDKPYMVIDKEPDNPPAISLPFAGMPVNHYIKGKRYAVTFGRQETPRFTKDVDELRTYTMDIRQVMSDNAVKDMLAEDDSNFILGIESALIAADTVVPQVGAALWQTIPSGLTRDGFEDSLKIMPSTTFHLEAHTGLINSLTFREFFKWRRDQMGGDYAEDIIRNGWATSNFGGIEWVVTIKHELVPSDDIFYFADPTFIGKNFELEPPTMYIKKDAYLLQYFLYKTSGGAFGNYAGLARATFRP
jgi:hypothetical protein